jgi:hypothetical protein
MKRWVVRPNGKSFEARFRKKKEKKKKKKIITQSTSKFLHGVDSFLPSPCPSHPAEVANTNYSPLLDRNRSRTFFSSSKHPIYSTSAWEVSKSNHKNSSPATSNDFGRSYGSKKNKQKNLQK